MCQLPSKFILHTFNNEGVLLDSNKLFPQTDYLFDFYFQIVRLSKEYKNSCLKSGAAPLNGAKPASSDEVFVWGSNSSHQLAEGSTDKILSMC